VDLVVWLPNSSSAGFASEIQVVALGCRLKSGPGRDKRSAWAPRCRRGLQKHGRTTSGGRSHGRKFVACQQGRFLTRSLGRRWWIPRYISSHRSDNEPCDGFPWSQVNIGTVRMQVSGIDSPLCVQVEAETWQRRSDIKFDGTRMRRGNAEKLRASSPRAVQAALPLTMATPWLAYAWAPGIEDEARSRGLIAYGRLKEYVATEQSEV
jgi:hypothetical protein